MKYTNQSFQNDIQAIIDEYPNYKVVDRSDEEIAHQILESQGMQLLHNLSLSYSRRPDLWKSFSDSNQKALVFFERESHCAIAALSESEIYYNQKKITTYYSSDLRLTPKASMRVRKEFREVYQKFILAIPPEAVCTTAILKDNIRAMNTFTKGTNSLFYNEVFEYLIRTIVVMPTIFFNKKPALAGYKVLQLSQHPNREEELIHFIGSFQKTADFSNDILSSRARKETRDEFIIEKEGKIAGYFSLVRPVSRSIYVKTTSVWIKTLLKMLSIFSRSNLTEKLPWVYLTSLVLSEDLQKEPHVISRVIMELRRFNRLKTGELLLLTHPKTGAYTHEKENSAFILKCPQILNTGVIFQVETHKADRKLNGAIHVDASEL